MRAPLELQIRDGGLYRDLNARSAQVLLKRRDFLMHEDFENR